jgi:Lipocalin-like domain
LASNFGDFSAFPPAFLVTATAQSDFVRSIRAAANPVAERLTIPAISQERTMTRITIAFGVGLLAATIGALSYSGDALSDGQKVRAPHHVTSIKEQIAGTWRLVSIYEENAGGEDIDQFGADPTGRFMADRRGNFSFQIMSDDGRAYSANTRSTVVKVRSEGILEAMTYFGTYRVDEAKHKLTLQVTHCLFRSCDGTDRTAELKILGDTMTLTSAFESSATGAPYSHTEWKRECCE